MNQFELFCMIFYVLDAAWDETKDPELGNFLSGANPFLFSDIGSADPSVFRRFCETTEITIPIENSYVTARDYIASLKSDALTRAFSTIDEKEWVSCTGAYLAQAHKGGKA